MNSQPPGSTRTDTLFAYPALFRSVDWRLRQWGAGKVQTFAPQPLDLKTGDAVRFTRNDREAGRINVGRGEVVAVDEQTRSEEHTSELQSLMRISYAVFCLNKKKTRQLMNDRIAIQIIKHQ